MLYCEVPDLKRVAKGVIWSLPPTFLLIIGIGTFPFGQKKSVAGPRTAIRAQQQALP
jgi:hypothetical protein